MMGRAFKNLSSLSVSRTIGIGSGGVLSIVSARVLGPESYGQYALVFVLVGYFSVLVDLGMSNTVVRDIASGKRKPEEVLRPTLLVRSFLYGVSAVCVMGIAYVWKPGMIAALAVGNIILLAEVMYTGFDAVFRGVQNMLWLSITEIVFSLVRVGLGLAVLLLGYGLVPFLLAIGSAGLLKLLLVYIFYKRNFGVSSEGRTFAMARAIVRESASLSVWQVLSIIYVQMNIPVISFALGDKEAGLFRASMSFVDLPMGFVNIFLSVVFPLMSAINAESFQRFGALIKQITKLSVSLYFPFYLAVVGFGPIAATLVFGSKYEEVGPLLPVLFLQLLTGFTLGIIGLVFLVERKQKAATVFTIVMILLKGVALLWAGQFESLALYCWMIVVADLVSIVLHGAWLVSRGTWSLQLFQKAGAAFIVGVGTVCGYLYVAPQRLVPSALVVVIFAFANIFLLHRFRIVDFLQLRRELSLT